MKKTVYFLILFSLITNCSVKKKPIFIKIDHLKLISVTSDTLRLKADVYFKNPNDVGGKIATDQINVMVNDVDVAQISSEEFDVPARNEFTIPLKIVIPTKKVFENNKQGILGGLLNSILSKSIKVRIKGNLQYKILGFSNVYPIDNTQDLKIKF